MITQSLSQSVTQVKPQMKITSVTKDSAVIDGKYLHYTRMTAAEEDAWREELALMPQTARRNVARTATRRAGSSCRKTNRTAAQIYGAMLAQVVRVNDPDTIPMDGSAGYYPQTTATDEYGVA
jgi:hypothetical protein